MQDISKRLISNYMLHLMQMQNLHKRWKLYTQEL